MQGMEVHIKSGRMTVQDHRNAIDVGVLDTWCHAGCPHKLKRCNTCKKIGHLARVCRSKQPKEMKSQSTRKKDTKKTHLLEADDGSSSFSSDEDELFSQVHKVGRASNKYQKLITTLTLDGQDVKFEVDAGAELSTIPARVHRSKLNHVKLQSSSVVLRQYDGTVCLQREN